MSACIYRFQYLDFTTALDFAETIIVSRNVLKSELRNFIYEIFDVPIMIAILMSFLTLTFMIWLSNELSFERDSPKYKFSMVLIHSFGAALNQGFPPKMKFGNHATTLAAVFSFFFMIISTIFSGLVIVKLLKREELSHIDTLDDLKHHSDLKIIVKPNSYVDDLISSSSEMTDLLPRIEYLSFNTSNLNSLRHISSLVQDGTHVLIDDNTNFNKYLKTLQLFNIARKENFYFSNVIFRSPGAWIMPKNLGLELKEEINVNLQWLIDLGHYKYYKNAINILRYQVIQCGWTLVYIGIEMRKVRIKITSRVENCIRLRLMKYIPSLNFIFITSNQHNMNIVLWHQTFSR